ncbi:MAG: response regulator [Proteobacteria bacterium]|nr:response regulator [Pseudomonadota bacterium]
MIVPIVLLVDDEAAFVDVLAKRLKVRGFEVLTAPGGQEALDLLASTPNIEVVVLDLKMPGLDGLETLARLKRAHPLIEAIFLTGHGTVESGVQGMKLGAFDYLTKPADVEKLVALVDEAAHRKRKNEDQVIAVRSSFGPARRKLAENLDPFLRRALGLETDEDL